MSIMSVLVIFFLIPFFIIFGLFILIEVTLIPVIFLIASILCLLLFTGVYFWIFLALTLASLLYLILYVSNSLFKQFENKKVVQYITILMILLIILGLIQKRFIHTEICITDHETGTESIILENFIN